MALDPTEVVVAGTGHLYVAPVGTAEPANISAAPAGTWVDMGYATPDGATVSFARESQDIGAWQSADPIRVINLRNPKEVRISLLQWNLDTLQLAQGGGTVTGSTPNFLFTPAAEDFVDERAAILEFSDGDDDYRYLFKRVLNKGGIEFNVNRLDAAPLPITLSVLTPATGASWTLQTNVAAIGA